METLYSQIAVPSREAACFPDVKKEGFSQQDGLYSRPKALAPFRDRSADSKNLLPFHTKKSIVKSVVF